MGRISTAICFILATLTVLCIAPPLVLAWACEFSSGCIVHGFWKFMIGPHGLRTQAVVAVLVPIFIVPAYVLVLLNCHRRRDAVDRAGRSFG